MIILISRFWFPALTIFPFIIIRRRNYNPTLLNHELIHLKQQKEMLIVGAYLWYWVEFICKLVYYKGKVLKAYHSISLEREAFAFQHIEGYPYERKSYFWLKLIKMPEIFSIDYDSEQSKYVELFQKPKGTIFRFTKNYETLLLHIEDYKNLHHAGSSFAVKVITPGTDLYTLYGVNTMVVVEAV